jgi:hypothetical protein
MKNSCNNDSCIKFSTVLVLSKGFIGWISTTGIPSGLTCKCIHPDHYPNQVVDVDYANDEANLSPPCVDNLESCGYIGQVELHRLQLLNFLILLISVVVFVLGPHLL